MAIHKLDFLSTVISKSFREGVFLNKMKTAVTPVLKSGLRNVMETTVPSLSFLCSLKIRKAFNNHLQNYLHLNLILNLHQSGFRPGFPNDLASRKLTGDVMEARENKEICIGFMWNCPRLLTTFVGCN